MNIWGIADLHLPGKSTDKAMDVFGIKWRDHASRIAANWKSLVSDDDLVVMPGDLSWAMTLDEALPDIEFLGELPGTIVLVKGNHDYWWQSLKKLREVLPPNVHALQNDFFPVGDHFAVCGARGWSLPGSQGFEEQDLKVYRREILRLEASLNAAVRAGREPLVAALHFPPWPPPGPDGHRPVSGFSQLLERYGVKVCAYGHLHGEDHRLAVEGAVNGVIYRLVSCDALDFRPTLLTRL